MNSRPTTLTADGGWCDPEPPRLSATVGLICSLALPEKLGGDEVDLEVHFFRIRRLFFGAYFFATLAVVLDGNVLADEALWHGGRIGNLLTLGAAVVGSGWASDQQQEVIAALRQRANAEPH